MEKILNGGSGKNPMEKNGIGSDLNMGQSFQVQQPLMQEFI